ncbi:MAG: hypothetical protein E7261_04115 [Lachnospiraceae bacterium]|nr:hypothetical protein [Lachnospiraceae bacterium]
MYQQEIPMLLTNKKEQSNAKWLLQEVLGYTQTEINEMEKRLFKGTIVQHISIDQALLIAKPFLENNVSLCLIDEEQDKLMDYSALGVKLETPKSHYYDQPIVSREHLINPFNQPAPVPITSLPPKSSTPTITCPYCKSTDTKKISAGSRWLSTGLFGLASGKVGKQWHCNKCKSDF